MSSNVFFESKSKWEEPTSVISKYIRSNYSLWNKQDATPRLCCTSNGVTMMSSICGRSYQYAFSGESVLPFFPACPWCDDGLVGLISRGARHSLLWVICWEWSFCLFCCQPGPQREDDGREGVTGTNSSRLYLGFRLSKGTGWGGIERPGTFRIRGGVFYSISSVLHLTMLLLLKQC